MGKRNLIIILVIFICLSALNGYAQERTERSVQRMIRGEVLNSNTRAPVPSAEVQITKTDSNLTYSIRTDEKGTFLINPRGLTTIKLNVKKFGYQTYSSPSTISRTSFD